MSDQRQVDLGRRWFFGWMMTVTGPSGERFRVAWNDEQALEMLRRLRACYDRPWNEWDCFGG